MKKIYALIIFSSFLFSTSSFAQLEIKLLNPSFEGPRLHSVQPADWFDCGFPGESKPDTQPGAYDVVQPPQNGESYVGMVVRDNETWESVAQRLDGLLKKGYCYEFNIHLCRSELYLSGTRDDTIIKNFATPAVFRIWGGVGHCSKDQLLAKSDPIEHQEWKEYIFHFKPEEDWSYILLEVFYQTPTLFPYNGNVLIDNASAIVPVKCE